jgi:hypothetical protein
MKSQKQMGLWDGVAISGCGHFAALPPHLYFALLLLCEIEIARSRKHPCNGSPERFPAKMIWQGRLLFLKALAPTDLSATRTFGIG